jgi:hypothetical protein
VLVELGWFVGRHHELVPVHRAEISELDLMRYGDTSCPMVVLLITEAGTMALVSEATPPDTQLGRPAMLWIALCVSQTSPGR